MPTVFFITNPYLEPLFDGAADFARTRGWNFVSSMRRTGHFPVKVQPDGILATMIEASVVAKLAEFQCPVVRILNTRISNSLPYPAVMPDYPALGRLGAAHLLSLGHPHLAFYRRFAAVDSTAVRDSFERELARHGRQARRIDFPEEYPGMTDSGQGLQVSREAWHARLSAKLAAMPKPCAIMAEDDRFGVELIHLAHALGLRVPQDVAVLGCDNLLSDLRVSLVPLSSVDANLEGVGYMAAQLLQQLLDGQPAPAGPLVAPARGVAARESTATFVCEDERVARVVCRIRAQYDEPLSVTKLAREEGMSVRSLQSTFKTVLNRSVREELTGCRMACAQRLLEETDLKMTAIAAEAGFGDVKSLARFFYLKHATTLSAFRQSVREGKRHAVPRSAG